MYQASGDTLRTYDLQEVVVRGDRATERRAATVQRLPLVTIEQTEAPSAASVARYIPSAYVQTNSRGESLLYLRGAGERQTALFFDGALLNIPWDNRLDLGLIPAALIGGMTVAKGAPAIEYGANVLGGAVNITSPVLRYDGTFTEASVLYGTASARQGDLLHRGRRGALQYAGAVGYTRQDGQPLPAGADLSFNQPGGTLRLNTDRRIANAFVRGVYRLSSDTRIGATLVHIDAEQGVAPEGHLPTREARLWRYPAWRYTIGIVSGEGALNDRTRWKASGWASDFSQTIDAYASTAFDRVTARQEDDDHSLGARASLAYGAGPGTLRLSGHALTSTHYQRDLDLDASSAPQGEAPRLTYRQHLYSVGAAYDWPLTNRLLMTFSGGYDIMAMPRTGDKPSRDPFMAYTASLGVRYDYAETLYVRGAAGRATRFPTMRELFGEALNRFVVNPALKPESAFLAEAGLGIERPHVQAEIVPFLTRTFDTINRRNLAVDDTRFRQRVNLDGSRVIGIEATADVQLPYHLHARGYLTLMHIRRVSDEPDTLDRLPEKPSALGATTLRYTGPQGFTTLAEALYTGRAYGLTEANDLVPLDRSILLNARLGYRLHTLIDAATVELFVRIDNATDALTVPQLGLPGPGRMVRGGVKVSF